MRERDIENYLSQRVREAGGLCYKWTSPGCRGVPDRIVVLAGEVFFVELKAPGKKPSRLQERVHAKMRAAGAIVLVIDTHAGVDDFIRPYATRSAT